MKYIWNINHFGKFPLYFPIYPFISLKKKKISLLNPIYVEHKASLGPGTTLLGVQVFYFPYCYQLLFNLNKFLFVFGVIANCSLAIVVFCTKPSGYHNEFSQNHILSFLMTLVLWVY